MLFSVKRMCSEIVLDRPTQKAAQWLQDVAMDYGEERMSGIELRRRASKELGEEMYDITKGNLWLVHLAFVLDVREDPNLFGQWYAWKQDCDYNQAVQDGMAALRAWNDSIRDAMPSPLPDDAEVADDPLEESSPITTSATTPEPDTGFSDSITDTQIANMSA